MFAIYFITLIDQNYILTLHSTSIKKIIPINNSTPLLMESSKANFSLQTEAAKQNHSMLLCNNSATMFIDDRLS